MPVVLIAAAAALGLAAYLGRRTSQGTPPSNPSVGDVYTYVGPDGTKRSAQWNGSAWVLVA